MNGPTLIAGAIGIVILAAILLIIRKQKEDFADEEEVISGHQFHNP